MENVVQRNTDTERKVRQGVATAWPIKAGFIVAALAVLSACGGGGGDDGGDNGGPGDGGDPGGPGAEQTLHTIEPARFTSEETVALLAPGSVYSETVGFTRMGMMFIGPMMDPTAGDRMAGTEPCGLEGRRVKLGQQNEDVASPFTGALFDMLETDAENCREGDDEVAENALASFADGYRRTGYPITGPGSGDIATQNVFIGYEESGRSLDEPFIARLTFDSDSSFEWARRWQGHVRLSRDGTGDSFGTAGGETYLYQVSRYLNRHDDNANVRLVQTGSADEAFWMAYDPRAGMEPEDGRVERYRGLYGIEWVKVADEALPSTCPSGRFQVETRQDLVTRPMPEDQRYLMHDGSEVVTGVVHMRDQSGNEATVTYDGTADAVTVELNDRPPRTYTYADIEAITKELCAPEAFAGRLARMPE